MPFLIVLNQELANIIGKKMVEVPNDPIINGMVHVGSYRTHLSNILYVKEI